MPTKSKKTPDRFWAWLDQLEADRGTPEIIPGSHDPILPEALTTAAGYRARQFRALGPRHHGPRTYPLTGLLFCAACGLQMRGMGADPRAYGAQHTCEAGSKHYWQADPVEAAVRDRLARMRYPAGVVTMADGVAARHLLASAAPDDGADARLQASLDRLIDLYSSGDITKDEYQRKRAEYEARRRPSVAVPSSPPMIAVGDVIREVPPGMLRDIARAMIERIEIRQGGILIKMQDYCAGWGE